jgi:transcriptional regulator with XRE-family HTH domain
MLIREKIKLLRKSRDWSQEYLAEKLGMSANGYGEIERGHSRITVEKLEELSRLFEVPVSELCDDEATNVFNLTGTNIGTQNCSVNSTSSAFEFLQLKFELEKSQLLNQAKDREIEMYKQKVGDLMKVIELLEKNHK